MHPTSSALQKEIKRRAVPLATSVDMFTIAMQAYHCLSST